MRSVPHIVGQAWGAGAAFDLLERGFTSTWEHIPQFTHSVSVQVIGGPAADLRRCWYLACAIAFGRIRRSVGVQGGSASVEATWDVANKIAQIDLMYRVAKMAIADDLGRPTDVADSIIDSFTTSGSVVAGFTGGYAPPPASSTSPIILLQDGPHQLTVGGAWPGFLQAPGQTVSRAGLGPPLPLRQDQPVGVNGFFSGLTFHQRADVQITSQLKAPDNALREWGVRAGLSFGYPFQITTIRLRPGGLPSAPAGRNFPPVLPDDGRVITTGEKFCVSVQPPRPHVDGTSRSSLVSLVSAVLSAPCYLPSSPPRTLTPLASNGAWVFQPGSPLTHTLVESAVGATQSNPIFETEREDGADGYPRLPLTTPSLKG